MENISNDPTPNLNPTPIPILFITNNWNDQNCFHCGDKYVQTLVGAQKYCKKCLSRYIDDIADKPFNTSYLDVIIRMNSECSENGNKESLVSNIQEWCKYCSEISLFKQICFGDYCTGKFSECEKWCTLCNKYIHNNNQNKLEMCSNCYLISSGWIESTLIKRPIPILYLSWWDDHPNCIACDLKLKSTSSQSQKYCGHCYVNYIGCRYCLTTNIIFGFTDQSTCKKCDRILFNTIDFTCTSSGNSELDRFLYDLRFEFYNNLELDKIIDQIKKEGKLLDIYKLIRDKYVIVQPEPMMEWIPYSQIKDKVEIARGGFGTVYRAIWEDGPMRDRISSRKENEIVAIKGFEDSDHFLNEIKSSRYCYKFKHHLIRHYGFTKDPISETYMLVMKYASGGDLDFYLKNNFTDITWNKEKLYILWQISEGLENIHNSNFIHRDIHSNNILFDSNMSVAARYRWKIGDLGLSQPANTILLNNEIYGVIPYIAPEIFQGFAFSKESDVYSMGMIMWELTTGCKPFANIGHDHALIYQIIDGIRPAITEDTPECYANLMKRCWDADPKKRPSIKEVREILGSWYFRNRNIGQFNEAELKRTELIKSKKLGPKFIENRHSEAIYTSRSLQGYITKAYELDINNIPRPITSNIITSRKRKIEESADVENHDNSGKHIKINRNSSL
ncbi:kinase-like domain-containing protein [Rhizophagus irregularis DAOM 181602=DAOM 197198]|uniref:Kinase-like domain-containing protein n=2 Tax=Rhizophagus irregularis (strain DAOM 181602 / DAOM 197198 / MUCL 43194) TaxID=747089 RepID=A0A2H5T3C7_RHIID|nr:kinase-like domain-containing protein [Rhizophagus irregularis DAOM 181602=DAOM 197198]POG67609.1 kinase-like domain-containing protein [Rhizophagus irregularis DAOM 181602=DAOM 197198]|eukprot:XP_025174475.1 kinase-like domain-containing protein [Rhizophagus irregularis DAOM 181602=DAOM 197198]